MDLEIVRRPPIAVRMPSVAKRAPLVQRGSTVSGRGPSCDLVHRTPFSRIYMDYEHYAIQNSILPLPEYIVKYI